jgi:hypothetical protein
MCKEVVMTYFEYYCKYFLEYTEKTKRHIIQDRRAAACDSKRGRLEYETEVLITTSSVRLTI